MDFMNSDVTQIPLSLLKRECCPCCVLGQGPEGAGVGLSVQLRCLCCVVVLAMAGLFKTAFLIPVNFVLPVQK